MLKPVFLAAAVMLAAPLHAQDIVGLEDCARAASADKKIGCLQSNVNFLHQLIRRNDAAAQARLRQEAAKLAETAARLDDAVAQLGALRGEVERLKAALEQLEKKIPKK